MIDDKANGKILGEIPLKSWRWLGVNELKTAAQIAEEIIDVSDGETKIFSEVNLAEENVARRIKIFVGEGARVEFISADLGRGDYSSDVEIDLRGDDSSADFEAVYFGDGKRKLDFNYVIHQRGKRTQATMNVRGALTENSNKIFRGTLDFQRGAKGSTGRELEEVIILSQGTRNRSVPLMLAAEDEVDGHHAVTVGRLDEEKIFYLMSRGLDKPEAERLIVEAAFNPVIEKISDENLRKELLENLQRRLG
ncbi:MAG: SufD family Fe-S cluster assembly protein [Selenomonadaceae bacterium]|nr:SufD family Fe-S cluster assembly protein [Selenomonadaceae bacterium]